VSVHETSSVLRCNSVVNIQCLFMKRRLFSGVTVSPLDETTYQIFAPSQTAMDEAQELIDELLSEEVHLTVFIVL